LDGDVLKRSSDDGLEVCNVLEELLVVLVELVSGLPHVSNGLFQLADLLHHHAVVSYQLCAHEA
jgi:hypothetical protein